MICSFLQSCLRKTFGIKIFEDPVTKAIIQDRINEQYSYSELAHKYKKTHREIKQIWYNYLGLTYIGKQYDLRYLPSWINGLDPRPAVILLQAGFTDKNSIRKWIGKNPKKLLLIDFMNNNLVEKIKSWLDS